MVPIDCIFFSDLYVDLGKKNSRFFSAISLWDS